jgi:hypothetical protein
LKFGRPKKIIAFLIGVVCFATSSVLPVHAALVERPLRSSLEEITEKPLIVPLQEEGTLPLPAPLYKNGWVWFAVGVIVAVVLCSEYCKPEPPSPTDATVTVLQVEDGR